MNNCKDCTYDRLNRLTHMCGLCEEKAIQERIKWWQEGKQKLREKEKDE